jgi:hypothetical protein
VLLRSARQVSRAAEGTLPCGETAPAATPDANGGPPPGASASDIKQGDSVLVAGGFGANAQNGAARSITILPRSAGKQGS